MSSSFVCIKDFEDYALSTLPKNSLDYYKSGAGAETTLKDNIKAFAKYKIRPRCLRDVSKRDLSTVVLGERVAMPIGVSPTAMQRMAHPQGECANVRAAQAMGTVFILSTLSTSSIEEVAEAAPNAIKWFQLYIYKDRELTYKLVKRAESAGFKALVLTVDAPMFGLRLADIRNEFILPPHLTLANFKGEKATGVSQTESGSGINNYVLNQLDQTLQWDDVRWLQKNTKLPIILKGILTAEDAFLASDLNVAGVFVSNHGARQVDGSTASIDALPEIVKAVGDKMEIFFDGGVRDGTDVFKALAMGAKMVFMGRPALWGLAQGGENGVKNVLSIIKNEFDYALALTGCTSIKDIVPSMVVHESCFSRL